MGSVLKRFAGFFAFFLGLVGTLFTARYPILPESLAAVYRVDKSAAINLAAGFTLIGVVACLLLIASHFAHGRVQRQCRSYRIIQCVSVALLLGCMAALVMNTVLVRASTRMADAIVLAQERDGSDLLSRDLLAKVDDDSVGIWQQYRVSVEFLNTVRSEELDSGDILNIVERAPLQDSVFLTYVLAIFFLKTGFFATSSAICLMGDRRRGPPKYST